MRAEGQTETYLKSSSHTNHYISSKNPKYVVKKEAAEKNATDSVAANHNLLIESGSTTSKALSKFIKTKDHLREVDWLRKAYRSTASRAAL